jgi:hypothetical protein
MTKFIDQAQRPLKDEKLKDELQDEKLSAVSGGILSSLANMRHEMLKTVANNLRA